jgi:hypothetical protein
LGRLLHDDGPRPDFRSDDQGSNLDLNEVAAAQLAVVGKIEQRTVSQSTFTIEEESNCPDLPRLKYPFRPNLPACIPSESFRNRRIKSMTLACFGAEGGQSAFGIMTPTSCHSVTARSMSNLPRPDIYQATTV